ncbi:MAG: ribonuclease HII [Chloroflexota bacterium]
MDDAQFAALQPGKYSIADLERLVRAARPDQHAALLAALQSDRRVGVVRLSQWLTASLAAAAEERERVLAMHRFERQARAAGYSLIAGVDEAGRGPLAGPVVAGAVILPPDFVLSGLNDSKQVRPRMREELYERITSAAVAWGVGEADVEFIERENILQATYEAMRRALAAIGVRPDFLLLDAVSLPGVTTPQQPIIRGDALSASIAAASIIAKVTRDRLMVEYDEQFPGYGFARHKGYGTDEHWAALRRLGPCPLHRRSFLSALANCAER